MPQTTTTVRAHWRSRPRKKSEAEKLLEKQGKQAKPPKRRRKQNYF